MLTKKLGVKQDQSPNPEVVLVDGNQLLYHIMLPAPESGTVVDLGESIKSRIAGRYDTAEVFIIFDQYREISAKDHERQRRAGSVQSEDYNLKLTSKLPA